MCEYIEWSLYVCYFHMHAWSCLGAIGNERADILANIATITGNRAVKQADTLKTIRDTGCTED